MNIDRHVANRGLEAFTSDCVSYEACKNQRDALAKVLLEEHEALTTWRSCPLAPKDLEEGFQISLSKIDDALAQCGKEL